MVLAVKTWLFVSLLALSASLSAGRLSLSVEAKSAILLDADSGAILYEKDAHSFRYPASTTKIATALYAIRKKGASLDELVTAQAESIASIAAAKRVQSNYRLPAYWIEKGGSHIGIKSGEKLPFRSLLEGMLIASGNDAANVVAQFTSGTIPRFMVELNAYLKDLGCSKTLFVNPHGHHHPEHRTTAYELALITKEALKLPLFCSIVSMKRMSRPKSNLQEAVKLVQTNRLIKQGPYYYPKAFGVKTGTGSHAKCSLVAAARDGGRTLIAVLLECAEKKRGLQRCRPPL